MFRFASLILLVTINLNAADPLSLEQTVRRVQAHLFLEEVNQALVEAKALHQAFPREPASFELLIHTLSAAGEEGEMMRVWKAYESVFPDLAKKRELLEEMCWGVLQKGRKAGGVATQLISLLGSAITQQVRAVAILKEALRNSNFHIRAVAVKLAAVYSDQTLREEIVRLFHQERVWDVQKEVLQAIGQLKMIDLLPELLNKLKNSSFGPNEKKEIVETIVALQDSVHRDELLHLVKNRRSSVRMLAAESIVQNDLKDHVDLLRLLLSDSQADVKQTALQAWGVMRLPTEKEVIKAADSPLPETSVTAAWALLLDGNPYGENILRKWLESSKTEGRLLAAAAVAKAGQHGISLSQEYVAKSSDPYVRANLALALLQQRVDCEKACAELDEFLKGCKDQIMKEEGFFAPLKRSTIEHTPIIPNYPEVVNQTTRLELLNLLAIMEYPSALDAMKRFLKESSWGVTGLAAEALLGEGDESALDLVKELMHDPDREIRFEAALVLASWGHDPEALPVLMQTYHQADRVLKLKILESLGRVGEPSTIPFLIERLNEPSQILRVVAACILIQTLNH